MKIGPVWAIYPDDVEAFKRTRRPPGRPRKVTVKSSDRYSVAAIETERGRAGTRRLLRNPIRQKRER
jgi:hypothetical protein